MTSQMTAEVIARRWCALTGEDPDKEMRLNPNNANPDIQVKPYWQFVAQEIVPMFAWIRCFAEFAQEKRAEAPRIQVPS